MIITDSNGLEITVTDLDEAILQADRYRHMRHDPPKPELDSRLQAYWTDIYNQLIQLKENGSTHSSAT